MVFADNAVIMGVPLLDLMKDNNEFDRTFKRYRVSIPVRVKTAAEENAAPDFVPDGTAVTVPGLAHNISLSGIGFVCSEHYEMGSLVEVEFTLSNQPALLLARVRWCRNLDLPEAALYHYGAQFLRTEATLQFIPVAAEFLLAQSRDRRASRSNGVTPPPPWMSR